MRGVLFSQCACFICRTVQLFGSLAFGHRQRHHFNYPESRCHVQQILEAFQQMTFWSQKNPYFSALSQLIVDFSSEHETNLMNPKIRFRCVWGVHVFLGSFLFRCARTFVPEGFWQGATIAGFPAIDGPGAGVKHEMSEWSCYIPWFILFFLFLIETVYLFSHFFHGIFFHTERMAIQLSQLRICHDLRFPDAIHQVLRNVLNLEITSCRTGNGLGDSSRLWSTWRWEVFAMQMGPIVDEIPVNLK